MKRVLFLCTGNYYRSRFAEAFFNHLAEQSGLAWRAFSRGLDIDCWENPGPISPHTQTGLRARGVEPVEVAAAPCALKREDLDTADLVVAVKEAEHRPLLDRTFPGAAAKVTFWHVHDLDASEPAAALAELDARVRALVEELSAHA